MKLKSALPKSRTNLRRPKSLSSCDVVVSAAHPEVDLNHVVNGIVRRGLKVVPSKASILLRIDADVLDWFKSHDGGYQSRINAVLRAFEAAAG